MLSHFLEMMWPFQGRSVVHPPGSDEGGMFPVEGGRKLNLLYILYLHNWTWSTQLFLDAASFKRKYQHFGCGNISRYIYIELKYL